MCHSGTVSKCVPRESAWAAGVSTQGDARRKDGAKHSNHANSTDCDDMAEILFVGRCARVCGVSLNLASCLVLS